MILRVVIALAFCAPHTHTARILIIVPTPAYSHQLIFRPIIEELTKNHQVTFITTNPAYPKGDTPRNLTEIDAGPISYSLWNQEVSITKFGKDNFIYDGVNVIFEVMPKIFAEQLRLADVEKLIRNAQFDLLILEAWFRPILIWSYLYKVPVLQISSMGTSPGNPDTMGLPDHWTYHPSLFHQKIYDLTTSERISEMLRYLHVQSVFDANEAKEDEILKGIFNDAPPLRSLRRNVDAMLLNLNPLWDNNRPLPQNVHYIGNINRNPAKELPRDLQAYLDSSDTGVIYMSFGTNVPPSKLPRQLTQMFASVFRELPYKVLWKWDLDVVEGMPENVKTGRWFPQADVFRHPNVKLVITQAGLQTSEEAIECGLPLIGIPFLADQWLNVDNYVHHGMGVYLNAETVTAEEFKAAIVEVIENDKYRSSVLRFRGLVSDVRLSPAQRVAWWTERLLRPGGATHMRAPAADMRLLDYLNHELLLLVICCCVCVSSLIAWTAVLILKSLLKGFGIKI
ncbi:UDP-glucuronosyltransferase 2B7-like [Bombyx mandarina]|uniref:UDP-glucuronosyltransferase 2B7-like n=1 Tax=Bombyx mandarina TaxID=7092 RepID=A0A6J2JW11_BOMMA|nr:UDP-glucuronosyltransferase 2B7-like [Bombyx mandarina]